MYLTNLHFYNPKNYFYSKPVKGLSGYGVGYGFGFNGQEKDDETYGKSNFVVYENRILDARLGIWTSLDPLLKKYPNESNYIFTSNNPILYIDVKGKDKIVSYTILTDKGTAQFDVVTKNEVMFTYIEKSDQMGNGGAGYLTFTDINQVVVLDLRTKIKPNENKTFISEEFSGKELGLVEGTNQLMTPSKNPTIPGGIMFTAGDGGPSPSTTKSKSTPKIINIESLLIYVGATHFGNTKLPDIKEGIGVAEFVDKLKNTAEAKKSLEQQSESCPNCGGSHKEE